MIFYFLRALTISPLGNSFGLSGRADFVRKLVGDGNMAPPGFLKGYFCRRGIGWLSGLLQLGAPI